MRFFRFLCEARFVLSLIAVMLLLMQCGRRGSLPPPQPYEKPNALDEWIA